MKATGSASKFRWQDTERSRLEGLRRSLQTTDRILSGGTDVNLRFSEMMSGGSAYVPMGSNYAVSIDNDITINVKRIQHPTSAEGVASILGLNYHELAHVLFSPQKWTDLSSCYSPTSKQRKTLHRDFRSAYMMLEEARVETLMGAKYPNMRKYFAYPIFSIMLKDNSAQDLADRHLLLHGRRFLPRKIRDTYRKFFEQEYGVGNAREFERLIDEYRLMPLTEKTQKTRAAGIIQDFAILMEKCGMTPPETHPESQGGQKGEDKQAGAQRKQAAAKQAKQETEEQDEKEQQDPNADGSGFDNQGGGADEEDDGSGADGVSDPEAGDGEADSSDSAEDGSGSGEGDDQDGSDEGSQGSGGEEGDGNQSGGSSDVEGAGGSTQGDQSSDKGTGSGVGSQPGSSDQIKKSPTLESSEILDALSDLMEEILDDEEVSAEIGRYQNAMDDPRTALRSTLGETPEKKPEYLQQVTPEMLLRSGRIADELRQIWAKMDSGWDYGVSEGPRLNMERASMARDPEDYESIYDDWEPGQQENSGVEFVIIGDHSGSMDSYIFPDGKSYYTLTYEERERLPTLVGTVSKNIWELMHALQEIDAHVTVLTYDSDCYTLYERGEQVTTAGYYALYADGGTSPIRAIDEARRILSQSTQPHKVLINFSDGDWGGNKQHIEDSLNSMQDVVKVLALLGEGAMEQFQYKYLFDVIRKTKGDILDIMAEVVMEIMRRSIQ